LDSKIIVDYRVTPANENFALQHAACRVAHESDSQLDQAKKTACDGITASRWGKAAGSDGDNNLYLRFLRHFEAIS
jgi:hypothetical protein